MSKFPARNSYFSVEDSTAASRSFHANGGTIEWNESAVDNPETTTFGYETVQRSASGIWDMKASIDGFGDWTSNQNIATLEGLKGKQTLIVFGPGGSTSGCPKWSACVLCTNWDVGATVKGIVTLKAGFEHAAGSPTYGTFP